MKEFYEKFLNSSIPVKARYLYLITFSSAVTSLIVTGFGLLFRINTSNNVIFFSVFIVAATIFYLETKTHRTVIHSHVFLFICNILTFPIALYSASASSVEVPIYGIIGLTFSLVLMEGRARIVHFLVHIIVVISSFYYCFIVRADKVISFARLDSKDYIRLDFAIFATGIICGGLIYYRNLIIYSEISEQLKADEEAEKIGFSKDMFLVNVSHEIRTPLNAIIGITDILLDSDANNHVIEMAYNISNSSHALLSITSDLLDFSRISLEEINVVEDEYDFSLMINDIINLISARLLDSNIVLNVTVNPNIPTYLYGDSGKVRQVIINILSNAVKYTNAGHVDLNIDYCLKEREQVELSISVEDTGIGIKPENLKKIFEPYNRSGGEETDRLYDGNGLGLALCRRITQALNGELFVESEYEKGSVFTFKVPQKYKEDESNTSVGFVNKKVSIAFYANRIKEIHKIGDDLESMEIDYHEAFSDNEFIDLIKEGAYDYYLLDSASYERLKERINQFINDWKKLVVISGYNYSYAGEPFEYVLTMPVSCLNIADLINEAKSYALRKHSYKGKFTLPNVSILVIDDNLINLDVTAELLTRYDCKVSKAASGKEGITCIKSESYDMVLLDYMMPEMDGIDTLKEIRKLGDEYASLPVICFSANVVSGARNMFMKEGFNEYLAKPIEIDKLEKIIMELLPSDKINYII